MSTHPPKSRHPGFRLSKYAGHQWSTYFGWPNVNLCGTCSTLQRQIVGFLKTHPWCTDSIFHDPVNLMPTWTFLRSGHLLKVARGSLTPETLNSAEKPWFEEIHRNQGQPASDVQLLHVTFQFGTGGAHLINKHEQHWCIPRKKRQHPLRTSFWLNWVHMFIVHASFLRGRWSQQDMQTTPRLNTYIFRVLIFYFLCSGLVAMCPQQTHSHLQLADVGGIYANHCPQVCCKIFQETCWCWLALPVRHPKSRKAFPNPPETSRWQAKSGAQNVPRPLWKQWRARTLLETVGTKKIGFPVLEGDPQQTKSVSDPPVTSSVCTYMMIPGVRRPSIKYIRIARATTATTTPNQPFQESCEASYK